jgi:hypothetical protein
MASQTQPNNVVSLQDYRDMHCQAYLTGVIFEAWCWWNKGINPVRGEQTQAKAPRAWSKEESDTRETERRREDNRRVRKAYKL